MKIGMVLGRVDLNDGVASHLDTLVSQLDRAGHEVVILSGRVSGSAGWEQREKSLLQSSRAWERGAFTSLWERARWLRGAIRRNPVDVLHLHGMSMVLATRMAVRWRVPVVAAAHPSRTSTPDPSPRTVAMLKAALPLYRRVLPDRAIAGSTEMAEWYEQVLLVSRDRVRMAYYGSETERFAPPDAAERMAARAAIGVPADAFTCVVVGRFDPGKRHETAVKALARLAGEGRNVVLVIAGSGDGAAHVAALRQAADPECRLTIRCVEHPSDVRPIYVAGDAIVHPSEREAFALVVAEAMMCGLVPLRSRTGGARDQIQEGVTGFVFNVGDDVSLTEHLRWLLDHPVERAAMGRAASLLATDRFGANGMAERIVSVYRELTDDAAPDARTLRGPAQHARTADQPERTAALAS